MDTALLIWLACSASFLFGWLAHALLAARRDRWLPIEWPEETTVIDLQDEPDVVGRGVFDREGSRGAKKPVLPTLRR